MLLVTYGLGGGHTNAHTHTYKYDDIHMKVISGDQAHPSLWLACAWFNKMQTYIFSFPSLLIFVD